MASDYGTPLSPYQREQERLKLAFEEQQQKLDERTALLLATQPDRLSELVSLRNFDEDVQPFAVAKLAKQVAENSLTIKNFDPELALQHVETKTIDKAVSEGFAAEEAHRQAEIHEAEKLRQETVQREAVAYEAKREAQREERAASMRYEKTQSARREPVPGAVERFNAMIEAKQAQRQVQQQPTQTIENSRIIDNVQISKAPERLALKGEVSDSRAERFAKMLDKPSSNKDFDATHDPDNTRNFSRGRGGRSR